MTTTSSYALRQEPPAPDSCESMPRPHVSRWCSSAACGDGTKGERRYDWALAEVTWPGGAPGAAIRICCWSAAQ
ncbi:hypothetical protein ACIPJK_39555 [Streptomyces roseus]|uniref:hypothetical protein n=1 Tax=Streptomyces roseus TaxID=66430 RepID=UPI0037F98643